jgi:hypothetical protein
VKHVLRILVVASLFLPPAAADSNWRIDDLTGQELGNGSETVFVVNLSVKDESSPGFNGQPLRPENLTNEFLKYRYNATDARSDLRHLYSSYWFSKETPDFSTGTFAEYEARGDSTIVDSEQEANATTEYTIGELTPVITTNTSTPVKPGQQATFRSFVLNSSDRNQTGDEVDVKLNLTDFKTGEERGPFEMNYIQNENLFVVKTVEVFDRFNASYYLEVFAEKPSTGGFGESSAIARTPPELSTQLKSLDAERCSSDSFPAVCQPGSELTPSLSVNESEADKVNATLLAGENNTLVASQQLSKTGAEYNGTITVPNLNTSDEPENMSLVVNASTQRQSVLKQHDFNYSAFELQDAGNERTAAGVYNLRLIVTRPFSPDPIPPENLSGDATVFDIDGSVLQDFDLNELTYREQPGVYTESVAVEGEGTYDARFNVSNQYDANDTLKFSFRATSDVESFSVSQTVGVIRNKTGDVPFSFNVTNNLEQPLKLNFSSSGELEQNISVNSGENLTVGSSEETVVPYNLSGQTLYKGEVDVDIEGNVTGYSEEVGVEVIEPFCGVIKDELCHSSSEIDTQVSEGEFTEIDAKYVGDYNSTETYQLGLTGNLSDMASVSNQSIQMKGNYRQDSATLNLTYEPEIPGFYSGNLTSDTGDESVTQSELRLIADIDNPSLTANIPGSIDLGVLPRGGDAERDVEVENTGQVQIDSVATSSESFDVEASVDSIDVGETVNVTLSFSQLETSSGSVTLILEDGDASTEYETSVSSELIPDYTEQVPDLIDRAREKESNSPAANPELGQAQTKLRNAESAYQQGNYDRARELFTEARDTVTSFEESGTAPGSQSDGAGQTSQPGDSGGGSGGLLIAGLVILILLVVGFVAATSIELEPGDPLYGVFGDQ